MIIDTDNMIVQEMPGRQWILQERRMLWYGAVVSNSRVPGLPGG